MIPTFDRPGRALTLFSFAVLALCGAAAAHAAEDIERKAPLPLFVNDAIGAPGGTIAIVLKTYAPRRIRQGQISVRVRQPAASGQALTLSGVTAPLRPVTRLFSATVYSQRGDSVVQPPGLRGLADSQALSMDFSSRSATINSIDGPLAAVLVRLAPTVLPGQTFDLSVDPAQTSLTDETGRRIDFEPHAGRLTIRAPRDPFTVAALGDQVSPGETATLGMMTFEPFAVAAGVVTLRFDPRFVGATPIVRMDARYGRADFRVQRVRPGVLRVSFESPDHTLNTVPGRLMTISMPTPASGPVGLKAPVEFDPAGSYLVAPSGRRLPLKLEGGVLEYQQ
jgi:hypothetical protein